MDERAIYIEETGLWYKQGASPLEVRVVSKGEKLGPLQSVKADSYPRRLVRRRPRAEQFRYQGRAAGRRV